jgi:hypothetical protein
MEVRMTARTRTGSAVAAAVLSTTLALLACGGGSSPSSSTTPTTTPTTTLPSSGGNVSASCALGKGSVSATCGKGNARLASQVEDAINLLVRERPQLFDLKDVAQPNTDLYKVLDTEAYLDGVVNNLRRQGACAERDGDDYMFENILVKTSNDYSERYDVLLSNNYIRRTWSGYLDSCTPSSFPIDRNSTDVPPAGSGCGRPYPPKVTRFNVKVHIKAPEYYTIDATPMVGPDVAYCAAIGYTDGRSICRIRPEGGPYDDGPACENWRVGKAKDTGLYGPTWTNEDTGQYCTGEPSNCSHNPDNQYQIFVYRSGRFRATDQNGAWGNVIVER